MYAIRRTIAAFVLLGLLFAPGAAIAAPQVPTLAQVLNAGNVVPADGNIVGTSGQQVAFHADGSISVEGAFGGHVQVNLDGAVELVTSAGGSVYLWPDGTIQITSAHGTYQQGLYFGNDGVEFNLGPGGLYGDLPTADPHKQGFLWNDNGTVKVSAG